MAFDGGILVMIMFVMMQWNIGDKHGDGDHADDKVTKGRKL